MELRLDLQHKRFDTAPIARLFTQGENNVDVITLRGAKMYGELDASQLTFILRAVSEKDTLVEQQLTATTDGDDLVLTWMVTEDFTAVSGLLHLKLRGIDTAGNVVLKLGAEPIYIQADIQGDYAPPQDVLTKALNDMRGQVAAAEEQAGIAKTEADRLVQAGVNFKVLGFYQTLEKLQTAVPNPARGDAYGVGDNPVYVYVWSGTEWQPGQELGIDLTTYYTKTEVDNIINNPPAWYIQSNPNLLINGDFSIWQRGSTFTNVQDYTFTADRWAIGTGGNGKPDVTGGNFEMSITSKSDSDKIALHQKIENGYWLYRGKMVTLSANIDGIRYNATMIVPIVLDKYEKWFSLTEDVEVSIASTGNGTIYPVIQLLGNNKTWKISQVKLELGDHATPFTSRLAEEEVALCQRYFVSNASSITSTLCLQAIDPTAVTGGFQFPTKMRAIPSVQPTMNVRRIKNDTYFNISVNSASNFLIDNRGFSAIYNISSAPFVVGEWYSFNYSFDAEI